MGVKLVVATEEKRSGGEGRAVEGGEGKTRKESDVDQVTFVYFANLIPN